MEDTSDYRLVPYNTVYKGTSKIHKRDENITHFSVHVPPSIFEFKKKQPTKISTLSKM